MFGVGGSNVRFDEMVAFVELEFIVRLDGAFEGAAEVTVAMLGVIVIEEFRDARDDGFRWLGLNVPPSEDDDASF